MFAYYEIMKLLSLWPDSWPLVESNFTEHWLLIAENIKK